MAGKGDLLRGDIYIYIKKIFSYYSVTSLLLINYKERIVLLVDMNVEHYHAIIAYALLFICVAILVLANVVVIRWFRNRNKDLDRILGKDTQKDNREFNNESESKINTDGK